MLNRTSLLLLVFVMALDVWAEIGTEESIDAIKASLQSKKFNQAINQVDDLLKTANQKNDFLIYLKALASFHTRDFQQSINACQQLVSNYPDSIWLRKTTFLQAKCYFDLKDFSSAEAIYNIEVERLLSSKRKSNIAKVYIDFAEKVSREPDENDLDAPPPNYEKAHNLYQRALELGISNDLKNELTYRLGRMMQLAGDFSRAIKDYQAYLTQFDADSGQRFYQAKY
ncbi:MAG: tetratricopeptide repeat protein, partial [Candidatus Poribacteria bacterium]|nr:tetratricopeptide repeat protein [Candidatus Poribacteria bacterium]